MALWYSHINRNLKSLSFMPVTVDSYKPNTTNCICISGKFSLFDWLTVTVHHTACTQYLCIFNDFYSTKSYGSTIRFVSFVIQIQTDRNDRLRQS